MHLEYLNTLKKREFRGKTDSQQKLDMSPADPKGRRRDRQKLSREDAENSKRSTGFEDNQEGRAESKWKLRTPRTQRMTTQIPNRSDKLRKISRAASLSQPYCWLMAHCSQNPQCRDDIAIVDDRLALLSVSDFQPTPKIQKKIRSFSTAVAYKYWTKLDRTKNSAVRVV
ncbi:hypothetical protein NE237_019732 [Protea cynaroides]|uniref:Uncharacterized protein n=1 Tax=Protea cynaroides TaxID=273540 RepID=A0A9Q0K1Y6_9MAGN|nr:hypothetical protein NE237_019732 [Protea cynaroides]